jgi:G:T/U-mismatch repair DNA glycosylase
MADAAEKGSTEEEDVAMDEMVELAEREQRDDEEKVAEQEENVLLPLLKSMFPQVNGKVLTSASQYIKIYKLSSNL